MPASPGAVVIQLRAAKKKRPATRRRLFDPDAIHRQIHAESEMLAANRGAARTGQFPALVDLLTSALADARSRRNRRRPMVHYYRGRHYRMEVEGFDRLVVYDYTTRRKLASTECWAL